jgi:malate dehydrogenase (oxaloacetate-decarboxylating)
MANRLTTSPQYSITMRLEYPHGPGWLAKIANAIAEQGGSIGAVDLVHIRTGKSRRDYTVECYSTEQANRIVAAVERVGGVTVRSVSDNTFLAHLGGKLEIASKIPLKTRADLSMAYTPGVARVCLAIQRDPRISFNLTIRKNCVAVVSDGSAVLGLGNIGPHAAMPVMEGKAVLFKEFGTVDAFPLCVDSQDPEDIIRFCRMIAPSFGGINLEDIAAPKCFEIEERLRAQLDIPVLHDDQHGTAVVVLAAVINALKITGKHPGAIKAVIAGAGAAGIATSRILLSFGLSNLIAADSHGAIHRGRDFSGNAQKSWLAEHTNPNGETGALGEVMRGADLFIGVSRPGIVTRADIADMAPGPIVFALGNPVPEIQPEEFEDIAAVTATGRSDYPNQINNVLAFPGLFRGALDAHARTINEEMKLAAAHAIAEVITRAELSPDYIVPSVFNKKVAKRVARAVSRAAHDTGVSRTTPKMNRIYS